MDDDRPPTFAEQIDAVQWACVRAVTMARAEGMTLAAAATLRRRLNAAIETLRMLERGEQQ
jgi:hypothetical protein